MMPEKMALKVIPETAKQFGVVKTWLHSKEIDSLVIATDAGREGELVARWILDKAGFRKPIKRLWISSQTDKAIREGFAHLRPAAEYDNLFRSARARSEADWLVGLNVTRALTCKYNAQLSAGRVQTPTLALIVEREEAIRRFVPQEFWTVTAKLPGFTATWRDPNGQARLFDRERAEELAARLQYDQARRDAEDLEERIRDLLQEWEELRAVRTQLEALLGEKAERLKELGGTGGTRLAELDRALDALAAQRREVGETLHAGRQAEQALSGVLDSLDSAESWGTWDMLGGGLFTTMAKHGHIDDARAGIDHAQRALSRFRTELADVRDMELPQVQIGEFATFADYFFDGFFMDWMVQSKIQDAQEGVSEVHVRVLNALRNLEQMDQELAGRQAGLESERKELLRTP